MSFSGRESPARLRAAVTETIDRCGSRPPIVLIDGPSGAGKSSLADLVVAEWPHPVAPRLVRMDDLYPGWGGLDAASEQVGRELLEPLRAGRPGRWQGWDWAAEAPRGWATVVPDRPLIVEGCGTLSRANVVSADLCIWLDADDELRKRRALARDGLAFETHWDQWQHDFERYEAREHPRDNASLILDVTRWPLGVNPAVSVQD